jgi:hypothetical protein
LYINGSLGLLIFWKKICICEILVRSAIIKYEEKQLGFSRNNLKLNGLLGLLLYACNTPNKDCILTMSACQVYQYCSSVSVLVIFNKTTGIKLKITYMATISELLIIFRSNNTFAFLWKSVNIGKGGTDRKQRYGRNWKAQLVSQKHLSKGDRKQREKLSNPDPYLNLLLSPYFPICFNPSKISVELSDQGKSCKEQGE